MDKRRHKRFLVEEIKILSETRESTEIHLLDIGIGGACIKSTQRLKMNHDYRLTLESEGAQTSIICTVMWEDFADTVKDIEGEYIPMYAYGVKFKNLDRGKWDEVRNTLGDLFIPSEERYSDERRVSGIRFKFYEEQAAQLNYHERYIVKKISYGGMLIESKNKAELESTHTMELILPGDSHPIEFLGRIASCEEIPDKEERSFEIGIEFREMQDYERERLVKFVSELYLSDGPTGSQT
jgi:hypothetical protein